MVARRQVLPTRLKPPDARVKAERAEIRRILHGPRLQAKLRVGPADDAYEREADQVMRMPEPETVEETPVLQREEDMAIRRLCPECKEEVRRQPMEEEEELEEEALRRQPVEELEEEEEELVRAKSSPGGALEVTPDLDSRIQALRGGGEPLPGPARAFFEPRFGHDFSGVRVHADGRAAQATRAVNAQAFTLGRDIVFGAGQFAPETTVGKRLLAHELTHTVQQSGNISNYAPIIQRAAISASINSVTMTKSATVKDSKLKDVATDTLKKVISSEMDGVKVNAIYVSSVNDGTHGKSSRHYSNLAVDLSRLKTEDEKSWQYMETSYPSNENVKKVVKALQNGFEDEVGTPGVRENFGPYIKKKSGKNWSVGGHSDHIHVSFNE